MRPIHTVHGSALACALVALQWSGAAGQQRDPATTDTIPPDSAAADAAAHATTSADSASLDPALPDSAGRVMQARGRVLPAASEPVDRDALRRRQHRELCRASLARIEAAVLLPENDVREDRTRALLAEAERYARASIELLPRHAEGYFLVAATLGLRSEHESLRRRVQLAAEVHAAASAALERDPQHAGAHLVLGRLNLEAMRASGIGRLIATHLLGSDLMRRASWEQAEAHLRRAAALEPDALVHRLWLARLHLARRDREAARREFQTILSRTAGSELDRLWQRQAGEELRAL